MLWRLELRAGVVAGIFLALFLPVLCAAQASQQNSAQASSSNSQRLTVRGVVRNALTGEPLPRALVRVEGDVSTGALTDGDGRFEIPGLPAGSQIFQVRKPGYFDSPRSLSAVELDTSGVSHNVLVAEQMPELLFSLAPSATIHGQIVLSTGDPAQGIVVDLLRRTITEGRANWQLTATAKANSEGDYRFGGLVPGVYVLYTEPALEAETVTTQIEPGADSAVPRSGYASVFYPDARDLSGAAKLQLASGDQAQANFTLTLEPFYAVTATASLPRGSSPGRASEANLSAAVLDDSGHHLPYEAQFDSATHTIQTALPEGSYTLLVSSQLDEDRVLHGKSYSVSVRPGAGAMLGSVQLSITGHAVTGLRIPLTATAAGQILLTINRTSLTGSSSPQAASQGSMEVMASQTGEWLSDGLTVAYTQGMKAGANATVNLPPGSYWLRAYTAASGLCEQSFTAAGSNLAREPLPVDLTGTAPPQELILRDDCARLSLGLPLSFREVPLGEEPSYTVYAVPEFDSTTGVEPLTLRPSSGGVATLENLTPGNYRIYVFAAPVRLEYRNAAVLAALPNSGQEVTLSPGMTTDLVLEVPEQP
jgi:hypothetical protein